ncbi:MAG: tRNA threonylcarbamoyladenosine dehydratase [Treponemataceae bacterium]|nr:tRNA threonylcarbamoyladenosine dehydratase [Treponemataceae bacterium]
MSEKTSSEARFCRTKIILGQEGVEKLRKARVAVFGAGGVGSFLIEALARAGIGHLDIIDSDKVDVSNINRQLIALSSTVGRYKTEVVAERIHDINPDAEITLHTLYYLPSTAGTFNFAEYDYIADAIDSVTGKISLVLEAEKAGTPIISCMGAGNKLDPSKFRIADIYSTSVCPLARVMRHELKKRGVKKLDVLYSTELPAVKTRDTPGSLSFVPSVAGLMIAGHIIRKLTGK